MRAEQLLIAGGKVFCPKSGLCEKRDILVSGGEVAPLSGQKPGCKVFDAAGMLVTPGLVDMHVHFREPGGGHKEDIATGSMAAARGGYTTVCCMPNTSPAIDCGRAVRLVAGLGRHVGLVNLLVAGALTKGQQGLELTNFAEMSGAGACALSEDGKTLMDEELMLRAARAAGKLGLLITDHCENHKASAGGALNEGAVARRLGLGGIPNSCEADIVARDIELARATGCRIHLQHISTRESLGLIREAKRQGLPVTAETAPHYFALTEQAVLTHGANAKMNPPLRTEADRLALIEGLKDGTIDAIATDHAPHSPAEKAAPLESAPFGVVGLETAFPVSYTVLVRPGHLTLPGLLGLMSTGPARALGLGGKGLATGAPADIAVFELDNPYTIDPARFASKSRNTPFGGMEVYGRCALTAWGGKITYQEEL